MPELICLVTTNPLGSNPRLVKEAQALAACGFEVHAVAVDVNPRVRERDFSIERDASWRAHKVGKGNLSDYAVLTLFYRAAIIACQYLPVRPLGLSVRAHHRLTHRLYTEAVRYPAALYIAHTLGALPAAARAAQRFGARLGFDAEDLHRGELPDVPETRLQRDICAQIEAAYFPRCDYLTAASPEIGERYRELLGVELVAVLNTFPLDEAPTEPCSVPCDRKAPGPSLYWFSQTIGPGRGLEPIIKALPLMPKDAQLHLRGGATGDYAARIRDLANSHGVGCRVHLIGSANPGEMIRLAACHDIGLSLETGDPENRNLCLTNKIFTYLSAGIPQLLSHTRAQAAIALKLGSAARLIDLRDPINVAQAVSQWLENPESLQAARNEAWRLGQEAYNWDLEQGKFLQQVHRVLQMGTRTWPRG